MVKSYNSSSTNRPYINLYTCGDSMDIKTWSNVPFLFARELEKKGYKLNRINIEPHKCLNRWYNRLFFFIFQMIGKSDACPIFARSKLHRFLIEKRLKKIARKYDDIACINLFLSYMFINRYSKLPSILWCDWPDRIVIERIGRSIKRYERKSLLYESFSIKDADEVYSMFPICADQMARLYKRKVRYLPRNVINTLDIESFNLEEVVKQHVSSNSILFIGNYRYYAGLKRLILAVDKLRKDSKDFRMDVIGMDRTQCPNTPEWVTFHGYLDKSNAIQRDLYYKLIFKAKMLVNTTEIWSGYSSLIEGMYYALPVILYPFNDFTAEFGQHINFGEYCNVDDKLEEKILKIADSENYDIMAFNAHNAVKDYTWSNYVDSFLTDLHKLDYLRTP